MSRSGAPTLVQPDKRLPDPSRSDLPWAIVGVSDDESSAFGYTNGLDGLYAHPELWMGHAADNDPLALQWCVRDITFWLNRLAGKVRDGRTFIPGGALHTHSIR